MASIVVAMHMTSSLLGCCAQPFSSTSMPFKLSIPYPFFGLGKSFQAHLATNHSMAMMKKKKISLESHDPLVGNIAPNFEAEAVFDQELVKIKLSDYIGHKYVVLFFYPLDFTFVCPTEITAFSDKYDEFKKLNTEVIGISTDSVFSHLAWIQTDRKLGGLGELRYPIVSDITKKISRTYNVLIPEQGVALRGLFIIDKQGVIQHATVNNLGIGRSVDETLRTLQAVQYVQDNPDEACPVDWKPGEKTMKPDIKGSKQYFAAI
ncbi:unnamed protein product [Sphagnum balticum]